MSNVLEMLMLLDRLNNHVSNIKHWC